MTPRQLKLCFFVLIGWLLTSPALEACSCAYRGPTCKWFPGSTDPAFVGRVVEMEPGSHQEVRTRVETVLRPYIGDAIAVHPESLQGEAFALYLNIYRDFWKSAIRPEALETLSNVSNNGEFIAWRQRSGVQGSRRLVRFAAAEVFAGEVGNTIDIYTGLGGGTACVPYFEVGAEYLVFANRFEDRLTTSRCFGTQETSRAQEDIEYLRGYSSAGALGSFAGVAYERNWNREGYSESSMAPGAEIEVSDDDGLWKTRTDGDGRFSIAGLQPGQYSVTGQYRGQPLSLGPASRTESEGIQTVPARGCAFVRFSRPAPSGSVTGRVFGPTAEPVQGITVNAVPTNGKFDARQARTDQDGRFEIRELQPGDYFVGVNINGPPSAHRPYATLSYPGVPAKDSAGVLQVSDGVATNAGTLVLGRRMRVRKILGEVVNADGQPLPEVSVSLFVEGFPYGISDYRTSQDGSFELEGLEETSYAARAEIQNPRDGSMLEAEVDVPAEGDAPITIVIPLEPAPERREVALPIAPSITPSS